MNYLHDEVEEHEHENNGSEPDKAIIKVHMGFFGVGDSDENNPDQIHNKGHRIVVNNLI